MRRPLRNELALLRGGVLRWVPGRIPLRCMRPGKPWRLISQPPFPGSLQRSAAKWKAIRDPAQDSAKRRLLFLWRRPGPLRCSDRLEGMRHPQDAEIVEAAADDLQPDRQPGRRVAGVDRRRRLLREVE